jgi:hypothetical protein
MMPCLFGCGLVLRGELMGVDMLVIVSVMLECLNKTNDQIFSGAFLTVLVPRMRPVLLAAMRPTF